MIADDREAKVLDWLDGQQEAMVALLETLVNTTPAPSTGTASIGPGRSCTATWKRRASRAS